MVYFTKPLAALVLVVATLLTTTNAEQSVDFGHEALTTATSDATVHAAEIASTGIEPSSVTTPVDQVAKLSRLLPRPDPTPSPSTPAPSTAVPAPTVPSTVAPLTAAPAPTVPSTEAPATVDPMKFSIGQYSDAKQVSTRLLRAGWVQNP